jgi:hypothetical protein
MAGTVVKRLAAACIVVLAVASASCDGIGGTTCTLIGCADGLRVRLDPPAPQPYRAQVTFPAGQTIAFQCVSGAVQGLSGPEVAIAICDGGSFSVSCARSPGYCTTSPVTIEVTGSDGLRRRAVVTPEYTLSRPNGPNCEPTCSTGTATLR